MMADLKEMAVEGRIRLLKVLDLSEYGLFSSQDFVICQESQLESCLSWKLIVSPAFHLWQKVEGLFRR